MVNDLILQEPAKTLQLPPFLVRLSIGTVQWPGQPTRRYLAGGSSLTLSQRTEIEQAKRGVDDALSPQGEAGSKARGVILLKLIRGSGGAALTELAAAAKAEAYQDATDDLPPWAVAAAVRKWHRGECGEQNYSFPPAPAVLRQIVEQILQPYRKAAELCEVALSTVTLDRAMDPEPIRRDDAVPLPRLRRL